MCQIRNYLNLTLAVLLTLFSLQIRSIAQEITYMQNDPDCEIILKVDKKFFELPEGETVISFENIENVIPQIKTVLSKFHTQSIRKAFPKFNQEDRKKTIRSHRVITLSDRSNVYIVKIKKSEDIIAFIQELSIIPGIIYAESNKSNASLFNGVLIPNDQYFDAYQWNLLNTGQNGGTVGSDIKATEAWYITTGSNTIKIGVFDSGIRHDHEDLQNGIGGSRVVGDVGYDNYHGTFVAGIIGASGNNSIGVAGINWNAILHSAKNSQNGEIISVVELAEKLYDAVDAGCRIINHSWGGPDFKKTLRIAFADASKQDVTSVASMGNHGTSDVYYPAGYRGIIAVGATDNDDMRCSFSAIGNHIDVVAPGIGIFSLEPGSPSSYRSADGTSFSSPQVTGITSLIMSANSNLYNSDIEHIIKVSSDDKGILGWDQQYGYGRVNSARAIQYVSSPYTISHYNTIGGTPYGNPSDYYKNIFYGAEGLEEIPYWVKRHEIRKTVVVPDGKTLRNVWGRNIDDTHYELGWNDETDNYTIGNTEVVTVNGTQQIFRVTPLHRLKFLEIMYFGHLLMQLGMLM